MRGQFPMPPCEARSHLGTPSNFNLSRREESKRRGVCKYWISLSKRPAPIALEPMDASHCKDTGGVRVQSTLNGVATEIFSRGIETSIALTLIDR
jgi:hypothetical protein